MTTPNYIYTFAGTGPIGAITNGAAPTASEIGSAYIVTVTPSNGVAISGQQFVAGTSGSAFGASVTAGLIYGIGIASSSTLYNFCSDNYGNLVGSASGDSFVACNVTGTYWGIAMTAGSQQYALLTEAMNSAVVDKSGNLVFQSASTAYVKVHAGATGTFYGTAMTVGNTYSISGTGTNATSATSTPISTAAISTGQGATKDKSGNLIFSTADGLVIMFCYTTGTYFNVAMVAGTMYWIAGTKTLGYSGDNGPALSAEIGNITYIVLDGAGNLIINDTNNARVRCVCATTGTYWGIAMTAGNIYTIAGGGTGTATGVLATTYNLATLGAGTATGLAVDLNGNLYLGIQNSTTACILQISGGQPPTAPTLTAPPNATYASLSGTEIFDWNYNNTDGSTEAAYALRIKISGASSYSYWNASTAALQSSIVWNASTVETATLSAGVLANGNTYNWSVASQSSYGLQGPFASDFTLVGQAAPVVGQTGPTGTVSNAFAAVAWSPAFPSGAAQTNYQIWVYSLATTQVPGFVVGQSTSSSSTIETLYWLAGTGTIGFSGDTGPASSAQLASPQGVWLDSAGDMYIADTGNNRIRMIPATTGTFWGIAMVAGNIYTIAGNGLASFSGDGGAALSAELNGPEFARFDSSGNLLVSDTNNARVRCVCATTGTYWGIAMTAGNIYTIAGGGVAALPAVGTGAALKNPSQLTIDSAGNVYIADKGANIVYLLAHAAGTYFGITTLVDYLYDLAGNGTPGFSGDGALASAAELNGPVGVHIDHSGNLLVADTTNQVVRCVASATATYYGVAMTVGNIQTVMGNLNVGYNAAGTTALVASFSSPSHMSVDSVGNVLIADTGNAAIRMYAFGTGNYYQTAATAGMVYSLAGTGIPGANTSGSVASTAPLNGPTGVFTNGTDFYIADTANALVEGVVPVTNTVTNTGLLWGSGLVASNAVTALTGTLPNQTTCVFYLQLTETGGELSAMSSTTATINYAPPATPTVIAVQATDSNGTPYVAVTVTGHDNLLSANDAGFEGGAGTWTSRSNATVAQSSAEAYNGSYSLAVEATAAGNAIVSCGPYAVVAGQTYTMIAYVRAATTARTIVAKFNWYDGSTYITNTFGAGVVDSSGQWVLVWATKAAPANATLVDATIQVSNAAASEIHYVDCVGVYLASAVPPWSPGGMVGLTTAAVTRSDGFVLRQSGAALGSSQVVTIADYEATATDTYTYSARVVFASGGATISSNSGVSAPVTYTVTSWWLVNPLSPTLAFDPFVQSFTMTQMEQATSHIVLGQKFPSIVSAAMGGKDGQLTIQTTTAAQWAQLQNVINSQATLWMTNMVGDGLYVRVGPAPGGMSSGYGLQSKQAQFVPSDASNPVRTITLMYQEVAQP